MGLAGLTAVFGMGTGVTPPVWSPRKALAGLCAPPGSRSVRCLGLSSSGRISWSTLGSEDGYIREAYLCIQDRHVWGYRTPPWAASCHAFLMHDFWAASSRGGQAAWLLGPVGCGARASCTPGLST